MVGVLEGFRRLGAAERREALARIALEQQTAEPDRPGDVELWSRAVHEALEASLGDSDGPGHGALVVRRVLGAPAAWAPVAEFGETAGFDRLRPPERFAMFQLLARLLVERAQRVADRADIPLTPRLVADNCRHLAGIFDRAFPGYLGSGLVGVVARMLLRGPVRAGDREAA